MNDQGRMLAEQNLVKELQAPLGLRETTSELSDEPTESQPQLAAPRG